MMKIRSLFILLLLCLGCQVQEDPLQTVLSSDAAAIQTVMADPDKYEVQIMFTEVEREKNGRITLHDYEYRVNDSVYFYPASTVKLPAAILALEKLTDYKRISKDTRFKMETDSIETSIVIEIRRILAVSDNEAYNRLFEFLGKDEFNERLNSVGVKARMSHRLSTPNADDLISKSMVFKAMDSSLTIPRRTNKEIVPLQLKSLMKGKGYMENDSLISKPKDFSKKNYFPVRSMHGMMKRLIMPTLFPEEQRFKLRDSDRISLINSMMLSPWQYGYNKREYPDNYVKFLVVGDLEDEDKPKDLHIYNKVGYAYGYLIDCAYIYNEATKKDYFITAVIHVNENGIFNDDQYEYDEIGIPFLAELGRQLVNHSGVNPE